MTFCSRDRVRGVRCRETACGVRSRETACVVFFPERPRAWCSFQRDRVRGVRSRETAMHRLNTNKQNIVCLVQRRMDMCLLCAYDWSAALSTTALASVLGHSFVVCTMVTNCCFPYFVIQLSDTSARSLPRECHLLYLPFSI